MVRHSTVKSRRRAHKVTRKPRMNHKLRVVKNLQNSAVKELYDNEITPSDNLISLGLSADPNGLSQPRHYRKAEPEEIKKEDKYPGFVGYVDSLPDKPSKPKNVLTEVEISYAKANIKKHGENYKAMERDIKTNYNQYTEAQMKKLIKRYNESLEEEDEE